MNEDLRDRGTDNRSAERPALLETGKGASVVYRGRALYSRHDPSRNPVTSATTAIIPPETLVLCISPLLGYGLDILLEKLPADCLVLALEADEELMALSIASIDERVRAHERFRYVRTASSERVIEYIDALALPPFRRCLRLDLSAGATLNADFYLETTRLVDDYISRYWKNHVTLMRLGRGFARDFFANLATVPTSRPLERGMANKPVLVAGAGPSLDDTLPFIKEHRDELFLLAVDTALGTLSLAGIRCDAVIVVESQFWIERAFAGNLNSRIPVFADLTARPAAVNACGGPVSFFLSEYAHTRFLDRFTATIPGVPVIPPLGSVGLAALYLARFIGDSDSSVLFTGLDFSFGKGLTHSRGAPASLETYVRADRFSPPGSSVPSLAPRVAEASGKNGNAVYSDPLLSSYASLCGSFFANVKPVFLDIGQTGLSTGLARATHAEAAEYLAERAGAGAHAKACTPSDACASAKACTPAKDRGLCDKTAIHDLLLAERNRLETARGILTGEIPQSDNGAGLDGILRECDYLYLHFPDGYRGHTSEQAFLRRVRVEIDYFLKTIRNAIAAL